MPSNNPRNERIKREYFDFLNEAAGRSEATVDAVAAALARFEAETKWRDFAKFNRDQAMAFKRHLAGTAPGASENALSKATVNSILQHVRKFFEWLAVQPGYKSTIRYSDVAYLRRTEKDVRIAGARRERPVPTIEAIQEVILSMPASTPIERRNQALIAFTLLTGARDSAIASMQLRHIDVEEGCIFQDAREVKTKFSKTFRSAFFPVGDDVKGHRRRVGRVPPMRGLDGRRSHISGHPNQSDRPSIRGGWTKPKPMEQRGADPAILLEGKWSEYIDLENAKAVKAPTVLEDLHDGSADHDWRKMTGSAFHLSTHAGFSLAPR